MNTSESSEKKSFSAILQDEPLVLVDFFAEWCGPCKMMAPVLLDLKKQLGPKVRILKVDVDKNPGVAAGYQIQGVPTFMLFKNGKSVWKQAGAVPASLLKQLIDKHYEN